MQSITVNTCAKINLTLDVTGRREDGYHLVRMVMQSVSLYDTLDFTLRDDDRITLRLSAQSTAQGAQALPMDETNLIARVIDTMRKRFSLTYGVDVLLTKRIPMAAGLAGGSADAAAAFTGINRLFSLGLSMDELLTFALPLGADIPFCLTGGTQLAEGIGEVLTPVAPLPDCFILLGKPGVDISTKAVYTALDERAGSAFSGIVHPNVDGQIAALKREDLTGVCRAMGNVLETVTIMTTPAVSRIRDLMLSEGALGAMMTGSGPTVFGIYAKEETANRAYDALLMSGLCAEVYLTEPCQFSQN